MPHHQHDTLRDIAVARERLVDPVADVAHLERTALHTAEADLAREPTVVQEQSDPVGGVEVALAVPCAAASTERLAFERGIGAARLGSRLPSFQPCTAPDTHLAPRVPVLDAQRPQQHPSADDFGHDATLIASSDAGSSRPDRSPGASPVTTARIARRNTFALRVFGSIVVNRTCAGLNDGPSARVTAAAISARSSSVCSVPGAHTTNTHNASPFSSSGTPTAAASTTAGWATTAVSTSAGPS